MTSVTPDPTARQRVVDVEKAEQAARQQQAVKEQHLAFDYFLDRTVEEANKAFNTGKERFKLPWNSTKIWEDLMAKFPEGYKLLELREVQQAFSERTGWGCSNQRDGAGLTVLFQTPEEQANEAAKLIAQFVVNGIAEAVRTESRVFSGINSHDQAKLKQYFPQGADHVDFNTVDKTVEVLLKKDEVDGSWTLTQGSYRATRR